MEETSHDVFDLYPEDLSDLQVDDLPTDAALASFASFTTGGTASCPLTSASTYSTASSFS